MMVSRFTAILRLSNIGRNVIFQNGKIRRFLPQQIRQASTESHEHYEDFTYRKTVTRKDREKEATYLGAFVWWWILWHLFTEYHELMGTHFPDPSEWTDEELGIPPL